MKIDRYVKSAIAVGTVVLTLSISFLGTSFVPVHASAFPTQHSLFALSAQSLDQKAKSDVDEVIGAGTSDKLEGYAQQAKGTVQKNTGITGSAEAIANQVQGRAKSDIGQVKGSIEDAGDASESLVDNVKDFFN